MTTAVAYVLGTAAFWAVAGAFLEHERDRRYVRLGFVATALGGLGGFAAFATVGAMFVGGAVIGVAALTYRARPARRQVVWGPVPIVGDPTASQLKAS